MYNICPSIYDYFLKKNSDHTRLSHAFLQEYPNLYPIWAFKNESFRKCFSFVNLCDQLIKVRINF